MAAAVARMASPPSPHSPLSERRRSTLSLDFSDLPSLSEPSPPTNTLIITNLVAPEIFTAAILEQISQLINQHALIHTFCPLKGLRRIIVSFYSAEDATALRQILDGESVMGNRVRVYFGVETKIEVGDIHLQAPKSAKLFFISPPPSPPIGWTSRDEDPPNKDVHADDLADALAQLQARPAPDAALRQEETPVQRVIRTRSGSTTLYDPRDHGHSPHLPAIAVEDTTESSEDEMSPMDGVETKFVHTSRPPVELMD